MTPTSTPHATPPWRDVIEAQLRAVGVTLRPALAVTAVLGATVAVTSGLAALRDGEGLPFVPELALLVALASCVLPLAVWRGEYLVRRSYLASFPVDRARHLLTKIAAGWAWLMALTAAFMLAMLVLAVATGGTVGGDEMRVLARDLPAGVSAERVGGFARRWTTPGWQWAVFFTTATVAYLVGSAVVLAGSRPRRWLAGGAALVVFLVLLAEQGYGFGGLGEWAVEGLEAVVVGRYGLAGLFGAADTTALTTAAGEVVTVWDDPPTLEVWALTTLLWTGLAIAAVLGVVWGGRKG